MIFSPPRGFNHVDQSGLVIGWTLATVLFGGFYFAWPGRKSLTSPLEPLRISRDEILGIVNERLWWFDQWLYLCALAEGMSNDELLKAFNTDFAPPLDAIDGKQGMDKNLSYSAAECVREKDGEKLRILLGFFFTEAQNSAYPKTFTSDQNRVTTRQPLKGNHRPKVSTQPSDTTEAGIADRVWGIGDLLAG